MRSRAVASRAPSSSSGSPQVNAELDARGLVSARTTGCRTSGSRPTACRASRSPSTSRIRGWRSSSSRRCSRSKAATPSRACEILRHEAGHAIDNAYQLRRRPTRRRLFGTPDDRRIPSTTRRSRTARASSSTSITGTRRAIPTRTSPRRSPSGSIPQSMWATRYAGWPAQRKLEYMDRLMRELARTRADASRRSARSIRCRG